LIFAKRHYVCSKKFDCKKSAKESLQMSDFSCAPKGSQNTFSFCASTGDFQTQESVAAFFNMHAGVYDAFFCDTAEEAAYALKKIYEDHVNDFKNALSSPVSMEETLAHSRMTYPYLGFYIGPHDLGPTTTRSYGFMNEPGFYGVTLTRPDLFLDYLIEQISFIMAHHGVKPFVGSSSRVIPVPFLSEDVLLEIKDFSRLRASMALPSLRNIDDQIANGTYDWVSAPIKPLSLFTAERVDYSLGRLLHYCGTDVKHFQQFILLTNYQRYVKLFFDYAKEQLRNPDSEYTHWIEPNNRIISREDCQKGDPLHEMCQNFQMPAYHLVCGKNQGITLINIGVGPSNAKNITDHLAVLRPQCWIMLGHCAGLRHDQVLGDYVLAHGYVRLDHVLDQDLPEWMPIPALPELETTMIEAIEEITEKEERGAFRSGTVVSTGDRNWELRIKELSHLLHTSRAIALDMESATLTANGFRFRVPYATLLCISDRPMHGELKLKGMAKNFYEQRVKQHLKIGIRSLETLRVSDKILHSRKLRGFYDPCFR
jgi:AMP nucleosidase